MLIFTTLAILVFNSYPLTAIMLVMLALLNDGAILSLACDTVRYRNAPEIWNVQLVLGVASTAGREFRWELTVIRPMAVPSDGYVNVTLDLGGRRASIPSNLAVFEGGLSSLRLLLDFQATACD